MPAGGKTRMTIRILTTGGTFDKKYDEIDGNLVFRETHLRDMLKIGRCNLAIEISRIMMIDSLDMTEEDRLQIAAECGKAPEDRIIITHGTDTMVETAKVVAEKVKGKTVVLTGAMIPYSFGNSDGMFNLGSVISCVQLLPPGVYIAMNGEHFTWDNVIKNKKLGRFERIR